MSRLSRRGRLILAAIAVVAIGVTAYLLLTKEDEREQLDAALAYLPADVAAVAAVETDLNDDQWESFARTVGKPLFDQLEVPLGEQIGAVGGLEAQVSAGLTAQGINYEQDVKPLLGGELVYATDASGASLDTSDALVAALEVDDTDAADRALREYTGQQPIGEYRGAELYGSEEESDETADAAIDGDVVVFAVTSEGEGGVKAAIDRARGDDHFDIDRFEDGLSGTREDALFRVYVNPARALENPEIEGLSALPWVAALESVGASGSFEGSEVKLDAVALTDPEGLAPSDLPFAEASGEPELVQREGEVASGSLNQSVTTAFLLAAARELFADSDFVRDVDAVERDLGIDFEQEVLRQFAGPSVSTLARNGDFAARSTVTDPEAMRKLLPRLAPKLPQLVRDLEALGEEGLLALLFVAPDAPAVPGAKAGTKGVKPAKVTTEDGERGLLYVIDAPAGPPGLDPVVALPDRIVFGMVGDVFVVASTLDLAIEIAGAPAEPVDGLSGASVLNAPDLAEARGRIGNALGFPVGRIESVRASVESSLESVRLSVTASYE